MSVNAALSPAYNLHFEHLRSVCTFAAAKAKIVYYKSVVRVVKIHPADVFNVSTY